MSFKVSDKQDNNTHEIEITVDGQVFSEAINNVYKKQVNKFNVPGFRKGKAPKHIIETLYGKEIFYDDAIKDCYPEILKEAIDKENLNVISLDKLETLSAGKEGFVLKAVVSVEPELVIEGYKGIEVTEKSTEVTEELIEKEIMKARESVARIISVDDRPAQMGDTVVIDFAGFKDGVLLDNTSAENSALELGSGQMIPGFEEQIAGHEIGESFDIYVTFPEDYHSEDMQGEEVTFSIKIHEIKYTELPELDDEFVKDVSEKETVEEYKEEIKETIEKRLKKESDNYVENQLIEKLAEMVTEEIPKAMFNAEIDDLVRRHIHNFESQGGDFKAYIKSSGVNMDYMKILYKPEAEKRVKSRLALKAIARMENIEITSEQIEKEYEMLAEMYNTDIETVKKHKSDIEITESLKLQKALDLAVECAVIKKSDEIEKERESDEIEEEPELNEEE